MKIELGSPITLSLRDLLLLLREFGVTYFKSADLEMKVEPLQDKPVQPPKVSETQTKEPALPAHMPEELKHPELMSVDTILNWSAAPSDPDKKETLPLTGDVPLGSEP